MQLDLSFPAFWHDLCQTYSPWTIEFLCSIFVLIVGFWVPSTLYLLIDVLFPQFSARHKIQQDPRKQMTRQQIKTCIWGAFWMSLIDIGGAYLSGYICFWEPMFTVTTTFPGAGEVVQQMIFALLAREVLTYYIHRALHHPRFYASIHKKHHAYPAPIAFAVLYAHPLEHLIADIFPDVVPLALLNLFHQPVHVLTGMGFVFITLLFGTAEHSGYDFAQPPVAKTHDLHHEKSAVNFSTLHFMDLLHGTNVIGWDRPAELKKRLERARARANSFRSATSDRGSAFGQRVSLALSEKID